MRWTEDDLKAYERRRTADKANPARICAPVQKPDKGQALEPGIPREETSCSRFKIVFHVYAVQPCDYDNYNIKPVQDLLVCTGVIPADDWQTLQGEVISCKAKTIAEERTEITITQLTAKDFECQ